MKALRILMVGACVAAFGGMVGAAADEGGDAPAATSAQPAIEVLHVDGGKYQITLDTTDSPKLTEWAHTELAPVVTKWYPKIVEMLPSDAFEAPAKFTIKITPSYRGVAATSGTRIVCNTDWFDKNRKGEARGAVVHEMVHVVQHYRYRRGDPSAVRPPGWLVEGIPDYIRWYLYEPQSHGADIPARRAARARYDGSYRVSANFLNWATQKYDKSLVEQVNAALRDGKYNEELWKTLTGKTLAELGEQWKDQLPKSPAGAPVAAHRPGAGGAVAAAAPLQAAENSATGDSAATDSAAAPNTLTEAQKKAGWILLFDGKDTKGWHTFRRHDVRPGWQVKDGTLACVDPHNAGDICTDQKFGWFELQLDYNISVGGNSGIMYHVADVGGAVWQSGPEFQLEDNKAAADPIRCGWLYALYQPPVDPKTGKTLDATKPAGEWNHVRLLLTPQKCVHEINGVKYFEYVLNSPDFKQRVAKSKFGTMKNFAKFDTGYIALQGDHGQVAFRNIMVKPIEQKQE
jgi:hypothetical protein